LRIHGNSAKYRYVDVTTKIKISKRLTLPNDNKNPDMFTVSAI
jgi:hypothetical protein